MKYILLKETTNAAGRVIPEGAEVEIHKTEIDKFIELGLIEGKIKKVKVQKHENAMDKQIEKENRKK